MCYSRNNFLVLKLTYRLAYYYLLGQILYENNLKVTYFVIDVVSIMSLVGTMPYN